MEEQKHVRFADLLTLHITNVIKQKFTYEQLTPTTLRMLRDVVHDTIKDVFFKSNHKLSFEALNWVSNQYFKSIKLNNESVESMIVINDYKLAEMPFGDIQLMRNLFNETAMAPELESEYNRRIAS